MSEISYGGQAVIEGVMMRGSKAFAVAVRNPAGDIVVHTEPLTAGIYTKRWGKWPIIRGLRMLWDNLSLGMRALLFSADVSVGEEDVDFSGPVVWGTVAVSLAFAVGLFFLLPSALAKLLDSFIHSALLSSFIEGVLRIGLFVGYIVLIGRWGEISRVFAYHGAEHKTINAYEAGQPLTPEDVDAFSTHHTRCGTSFLLIVLVLSILIFAPFRFDQWHFRLLSRLLLIPLVAGIAYEFIKMASRNQSKRIVRWLTAPGIKLQELTTRKPDVGMIEVAIAALQAVLTTEQEEQPQADERIIPATQDQPAERRLAGQSPGLDWPSTTDML